MYRAIAMLIVAFLTMSACTLNTQEPLPSGVWRCPPLPEDFQESHLVGTWQAKYGTSRIDTLILRGDGTYKQIFVRQTDGYYYESGWNQWRLEYRASGGLYLHLDKMRRCDMWEELCEKEGGGVGYDEWGFWDYCEDRIVYMPDGVVLMVTGVTKAYERSLGPVPRGIQLRHMKDDPDSQPYLFTLQEEKPALVGD